MSTLGIYVVFFEALLGSLVIVDLVKFGQNSSAPIIVGCLTKSSVCTAPAGLLRPPTGAPGLVIPALRFAIVGEGLVP